jgi:hypothetical protein
MKPLLLLVIAVCAASFLAKKPAKCCPWPAEGLEGAPRTSPAQALARTHPVFDLGESLLDRIEVGVSRAPQKRTIEDAWGHIGSLVDTIDSTECNNYFANAGYASVKK